MIELAVLGLLKEQPLHGYEIKKRLGETLGALWGVSYGSLYPALRRLERAEAIAVLDPLPDARVPQRLDRFSQWRPRRRPAPAQGFSPRRQPAHPQGVRNYRTGQRLAH